MMKKYRILFALVAAILVGSAPCFAAPASGIVQSLFVQKGAGAVPRTFAEKASDTVSVKDFGARCDGATDDTAAIQNALSARAAKVLVPDGTCIVSAMLTTPTNVTITGAGVNVTTIKAAAGFVGASVIQAGNPTALYSVTQVSISGLTIDIQNNADAGLSIYGLQDGSNFEALYVRNLRKYGIRSNWSTDGTSYLMNEGVLFANVHVLGPKSGTYSGGAYWDMNGIYESTFVSCKALGFASVTYTGFYGWSWGANNTAPGSTGAMGNMVLNSSAANLYGTGNVGTYFGDSAWIRDEGMTYENIQGTVATFSDKATFDSVIEPRIYNPAADATVFPTHFSFTGNANNNKAVRIYTTSTPTKLADFSGSSYANAVEYLNGSLSRTDALSRINFNSAAYNNRVDMFTDSSTIKHDVHFAAQQYSQQILPNGTTLTSDQYNTTLKQPAGVGIKIFDSTGVSRVELDTSNNVRILNQSGVAAFVVTPAGKIIVNASLMSTTAAAAGTGEIWMDTTAGNTLKVK